MKTCVLVLLVFVLLAAGAAQAPALKDFSGIWLLDLDRSTFQTSNPPVFVRTVIAASTPAGSTPFNRGRIKITRVNVFRDGSTSGWSVEINNSQVVQQTGFPAFTSVKVGNRDSSLVIEQNARFQNGASGAVTFNESLIDDNATLLSVEQVTAGGHTNTDRLYFVRK
jgi:hypothetical protein